MSISAEDLLAGPRGRRFLLELATADDCSPRLGRALFETVRVTFGTPGMRYARLRSPGVIAGDDSLWGEDPDAIAEASPAGLARLLLESPLVEPSPRRIWSAVTAAVDTAAYWQGPDREDRLAVHPALQGALLRLAEHVLPFLPSWWAQPAPRDDSSVVVRFEGGPEPLPAQAPPTLAAIWERWVREEARQQGIWWSTPPLALPRTSRTAPDGVIPGLVLVEDGFGWESAQCLPARPPADARILTIGSAQDWIDLCRRAPLDVTSSRRENWKAATGRRGRWIQPDWSLLAREADGIHLTLQGYLSAAGRALTIDARHATLIAGFSPDETVWFLPVPVEEDAGRSWVLAADQETWSVLGPGST